MKQNLNNEEEKKMEAKQIQRESKKHVVVLSYPSQGHINPLLQFAKRLVSKGLTATFATTHYTVNSISAVAGLQVEPISDGFDEGGFARAADPEAYVESFKKAGSATLSNLLSKLQASGSPVCCLVYDAFLPWALHVARQHRVYGASFLTNSATVCSMYWRASRGLLPTPVTQQVCYAGLPKLGFSDMPSFLASPGSYPVYLRVILGMFSNMETADWVFANTFEDLESQVREEMSAHWTVTMIGPMVPSAYLDGRIDHDTNYGSNLWNPITGDECLKWLENKPPMSVVYVSFGSMAEVEAIQIEEIAKGLSESNHYFIWVLRESERSKLPKNFVDSGATEDKGLVVQWCNQLEVLAHESIGCFVSHCGWNSTLEALSLGVPMVGVPQWTDQPTNAKFVEEVWGVGVRAKVDKKGIVRRDELGRCIVEVMEGERSQDVKRSVRKWRELAKGAISEGGSSDKGINEFVGRLLN